MQKDQTIAQPIYQNFVKQYQWGSTDPNCIVASLSNKQCKKWAQLWMGVHQSGSSLIKQSKNLAEFLEQKKLQPIDFLYKVLSIEKCLSIQVHPNKKQAEILHKEKPNIYVDNNDKPEMFMTISDFQCFMGLISSKQFERIVGYEPFVSRFKQKQSLRDLLLQILDCQQAQIQQIINALFQQDCLMLRKIYDKSENCRVQLMKRLQEQFPYDVGIIVTMLLQYHNIPKKHCFYIKPKIAHAYIKGQCFQIMKNSDNVVRLGLTGKLKDIDTMMSILDFSDENNCLHQV